MSEKRIAIIERCGQCHHCNINKAFEWRCARTGQEVCPSAAPPAECPHAPCAEVARVKPLAWKPIDRHGFIRAKLPYRRYAVGQNYRGELVVVLAGRKGKPCESIEDGKAKAEAHYRAALFGEGGPLEPLA